MSDLVYQSYNNKCKGWTNPSNLSYGPEIISLSSYQSPAGSNTVVSINGTNFFSYSTIRFGTFTPTVYFVNSTIIQFYVPNTLNSGTFPVQVCNGSVCSNTFNYTIDNASGYWLLNGQNITNSNENNSSGGIVVSWLSRGIPQSISNLDNSYHVPNNVTWITCNTGAGDVHISLPEGTEYNGRELIIKRLNTGTIISDTALVTSFDENTTSDIILSNIEPNNYSWVTLVYNGAVWITMQAA